LTASSKTFLREAPGRATSPSLLAPFRQGVICNLTNPTSLSFMLAILPQFVAPSAGSPALQFFILGVTMKATGLLVLGAVALTSGTFSNWLSHSSAFVAWQQRIAGSIMIALGIRLLLSPVAPALHR